jgi:hypothetical protein
MRSFTPRTLQVARRCCSSGRGRLSSRMRPRRRSAPATAEEELRPGRDGIGTQRLVVLEMTEYAVMQDEQSAIAALGNRPSLIGVETATQLEQLRADEVRRGPGKPLLQATGRGRRGGITAEIERWLRDLVSRTCAARSSPGRTLYTCGWASRPASAVSRKP